MAISVDGAGNIYVTDFSNHRVQTFSPQGAFLAKWGSQGTGSTTPLTGGPSPEGPCTPRLSLSSSGAISGIPTAAGRFTFTARVTDSSSPVRAAGRRLSITVER